METVFITVHDLSPDATIKYCSDSVEDILGYLPHELKGKSCWEYFHEDELPSARAIHGRGIELDKAAVLNYCRLRHKDGSWVGCECVFTIVHDVIVASTAIYRRGPKARQRAIDGAGVRRVFSSSPRDPRYHMLSYLSDKFCQEPKPHYREPRAALFLNRFTRTLTVMFATNGVAKILGIQPNQLVGKSFYFCIAENCLPEAVKCLESAKANDSIAYLRFWYRDPLQPDPAPRSDTLPDANDSDDDDDGGVSIRRSSRASVEMDDAPPVSQSSHSSTPKVNGNMVAPQPVSIPRVNGVIQSTESPSRSDNDASKSQSSSGNSTDLDANASDAIFDPPTLLRSNSSQTPQEDDQSIEIEAVVSCTSDGLVVVLRRANPLVPPVLGATNGVPRYADGLFASPWAAEPVLPDSLRQTTRIPTMAFPVMQHPTEAGLMAAIRDVAVFAWSLTGINGSLTDYAHGEPQGESLPPGGLPIWDPNSDADPDNRHNGFLGSAHRPFDGMGEPQRIRKDEESSTTSSDDEVVWKRAPTMSKWRQPRRRGHHDAFGVDGCDGVDGASQDGCRKRPNKSPDKS